MPANDAHFTSISGLQNVSTDLSDLQNRFDNIMMAIEETAKNTFGVWDGSGKEEAVVANTEFNEKFGEVQDVFRSLIGANDDVTGQMQNLHSRLESQFQRR